MRSCVNLLVILLMISCTNHPGELSEPPGNLKIAYNVWYDMEADDYEIFVMDTDGSNKTNISNWEGVDWVYYGYGEKLFFISDRDTTHRVYFLYEMDANGENVRKITNFEVADSWLSSRKNGTEMIVRPHSRVDSMFYIINMEGDIVQKVDSGLPYQNDPFFSPDGEQIVFRGAHAAFKRDSGYLDELYIMNTDGTGLRRLTHYPEDDTTAQWYSYHAGPPYWKQDNHITYNSVQRGRSSLYSIHAESGNLTQITPDSTYEAWHAWSPDENWLVYDAQSSITDSTHRYDIFLRNLDGNVLRLLTDEERYNQGPVFVESPGE